MRNRLRRSLSLKLRLGITLMAVPVFTICLGMLFIKSRNLVRQKAMERSSSVLNAMVERISNHLSIAETATASNDWQVTENLQPDSLLAITRRIVQMNGHVTGCSITTEPNTFPQYGRYFSAYSVRLGDSISTVREKEYEYFEKAWYKLPLEMGRACWIDPFDDTTEGTLSAQEPIASYSKPLYAADGHLVGVISTDLSLSQLAKVIADEHPYEHAYYTMLGRDGYYYIHPDSTLPFHKTIFEEVNPLQHADIIALGHEMTAGKKGTMKVLVNGEPCLVSYQSVPGTPWSMALVCPDSDILKGYHKLTYIIVPLLLVGWLLIMISCRKAVAHVIRPVNVLLHQSQRMAQGFYDEEITFSKRKDIVGQLQNSFATMQRSLNTHIQEVGKLADEMRLRNEELAEATHLAEEADHQKTLFIQNMTHQIRTPLNIIMGFSQVLRDTSEQMSPEDLKSITDMMAHNMYTLNRMVLMLFDSSDSGRSEEERSMQREEVACYEVVREAIAYTHEHFANLNISMETELEDDFLITTNRLYLMRSLREILYNSAKYSDGQNIKVRLGKTGQSIRFIFEDKGPGIPEEYYPLMFIPFTKVNDLSEGLGLGLPLSKNHIDHLGGHMDLDRDYHEGCRFIIELPLSF